jgi:serine/threonine protein phosphatase 1
MIPRFIRSRKTGPDDGRPQRIYAIGDVHGRLDLLDELITRIDDDVRVRPEMPTRIIVLGDFIDRGPSSAMIIELFVRLRAESNVIVLMGNHERTMLDALDGDHLAMELWLAHGGLATLESFGANCGSVDLEDTRAMIKLTRSHIPKRVEAWIRGLPSYVHLGDHYFVHAGIRPGVSLEDQSDEDRLWIRDDFTDSPEPHGAVVVHGHTIYEQGVSFATNRIGIDTGAYRTNRLSALAIEEGRYWVVATSDDELMLDLSMRL